MSLNFWSCNLHPAPSTDSQQASATTPFLVPELGLNYSRTFRPMLCLKFVSISPCLLSGIDADIVNPGDVKMLWAPLPCCNCSGFRGHRCSFCVLIVPQYSWMFWVFSAYLRLCMRNSWLLLGDGLKTFCLFGRLYHAIDLAALNSQQSSCLSFMNARITGVSRMVMTFWSEDVDEFTYVHVLHRIT